jgi:hypothetical protein
MNKICTKTPLKQSIQKIPKNQKTFIYNDYDDPWSHGEVAWEFSEREYYLFREEEIQPQKLMPYYYEESRIENTIYEKYFKNKIYFRVKFKKTYFKTIYSALIKAAYRDIVKIETFATDIHDFALDNLKGENVESELFMVLLASALGIVYHKNKEENITDLKKIHKSIRKKEFLENYRKIKKATTIFFVVFTTILNKNVKNAE